MLFAHAGIADRRMWDHQMAALADRYHVIRYDQRGFGRSGRPARPFSHVADLHAMLDHAGAGQAVGATVIDYALAHPGWVAALVPVAAGVSGFPWQPTEVGTAARSGDPGQLEAAVLRTYLPLRTSPEVDARIRQLLASSLAGLAELGTMWAAFPPAYERLSDIHVPTLVVAGDRDHDNFIRIAELLAREIPGARLVVLPDADHNIPVRAAAAFTRLLTGFLDGLPHWPPAARDQSRADPHT